MTRRIATGIDIGTAQVKLVVLEEVADKRGQALRVIGTGVAPTRGMRQGFVVNKEDVVASLRAAKQAAEQMAHVPITTGFLAIGCASMDETRATGETIISRADQEVTDLDLETTLKKAREAAAPNFLNRQVLHEIPLEYRVDGAKSYGDPVGLKGTRLEADYLFVTCLTQQVEGLVAVAEEADIDILDQMASPLAGSHVSLANDQKMKGCVLANIGAETTSIVVYDEGIPLSVKVFPEGSSQVTDDIALAFKVPIEDAEKVKLGRLGGAMYPRKKVDDIISTRLSRTLQAVEKHLKTINRRGPLPAGIVLAGGGATTSTIIDIARKVLSLPAKTAELHIPGDTATNTSNRVRDSIWAVAYGMAFWGLSGDTEAPRHQSIAKLSGSLRKMLRQFLP